MNIQAEQPTSTKIPTKKILLWIAMASMIMMFAGLTSAYMVRQAEGNWLEFDLPGSFNYSTMVLLVSSLTMNMALVFAKRKNHARQRTMLLLTLGLGACFVMLQFEGWKELVQNQVFFGGKTANPAGSFLYVLTGLHLAHLAGGLLALLYCIFDVIFAKAWGPKNLLSVQLCAIFWHFLGGLWVYLFLFLLLVR